MNDRTPTEDGEETPVSTGNDGPYQYQWSPSGQDTPTVELSSGDYAVGITDSQGPPENFVYQTPAEIEQEAIERTNATYFNEILETNGEVDGEAAIAFMDYITKIVMVEDVDENGEPAQFPTMPNVDAFKEHICKHFGLTLEDLATNPDPRVSELYTEVLENIRGAIYEHGKEHAEDPAVFDKCNEHLIFLGSPEQPSDEEMAAGVGAGLGIMSSNPEILDQVADIKTKAETLFDVNDDNIKSVLAQCTTLDDETTAYHLSTMVARIIGPNPAIQVDATNMIPENPIEITAEGQVIVYAHHPSIKGKTIDQTLPFILGELTDSDELTQEYFASLLTPHRSIIGTNPVVPEGQEQPEAEAENPIAALIKKIFGAIWGSESEDEAQMNALGVIAQDGSGALSGFSDMFGFLGDGGQDIQNGAMNMFMTYGPGIVSSIFGLCNWAKAEIGHLTGGFNTMASNDGPSNAQQLEQNIGDISNRSGNGNTNVNQDPNAIANVKLT